MEILKYVIGNWFNYIKSNISISLSINLSSFFIMTTNKETKILNLSYDITHPAPYTLLSSLHVVSDPCW